jgi:uncharacterized protein YcbX
MTAARVESLWRFPIKSHGREALERVTLETGRTMPWDRVWAVAHEKSDATDAAWMPCAAFSRVGKAPRLMAVTARLDEATETLTLSHPDRPDLSFRPGDPADTPRFLDWVRPLMPENRAASARFVRVPGRGMTDSDFPSVTLCNMASHRAVEQRLGRPLSIHRWRGNIWADGLGPWEEFEWIGREIRVGGAVLRPRERTDRCAATTANPDTGRQDADTLGALESWGHTDFSVRCEIVGGGEIAPGDPVMPL